MSFVGLITEEQASPELKRKYQAIRDKLGFLPNYFQALARNPKILDEQIAFGAPIMEDGALPRKVKEQVGVVVSGLNTSSYCVAIHMEFLRQFGIEKPISRKLATDYPNAPVDDKVQALFRFADKLTRHPDDIGEADMEMLRKAGWEDDVIFELVMTVAYFNFVNRVSIGLGLVADF